MSTTKLTDTLSSKEGMGFITIDGRNRRLYELSKISAQLDIKKQTKAMLGKRMDQNKVVGMAGTGNATFYIMASDYLEIAEQYKKTGIMPSINIQMYNEDPQSTVGRQEVLLQNVILDTIPLGNIDDGSDEPITFDSGFTFDDYKVLSKFKRPSVY